MVSFSSGKNATWKPFRISAMHWNSKIQNFSSKTEKPSNMWCLAANRQPVLHEVPET
jgi:hypothetical protein